MGTMHDELVSVSKATLADRERTGRNPLDGICHLVTGHHSYRFEGGTCVLVEGDERSALVGMTLIGFVINKKFRTSFVKGARAVLFDEQDERVAISSVVNSFERKEFFMFDTIPTRLPRIETIVPIYALKTNASIPTAKLLKEKAKRRVPPPSYVSPDKGSGVRIDTSLLDRFLSKERPPLKTGT
ncbi:MAG: hypothetical protein KBF88_10045 [Polyangiaceae bacterium]|nr:hypothetical protein [Polyangiaceae bacterium]